MRRLILITTWYGPDTVGGAENLCRRLAEELHRSGCPVEVWSTTSRGYTFPWFDPYYPPGLQEWNGVPVRRFPVARWNECPFWDERLDLLYHLPVFPPEEVHHLLEMPQSDGLFRAIADDAEAFFVFFIYSHNLTFWGAQIAPERSFLLPCLHDEPYAYHAATAWLMAHVPWLVCLSEPERALALGLYRIPPEQAFLIGVGIDTDAVGDASRFRSRYGIEEPFLLYVGRRDIPKGVPWLVEYFCRYRRRRKAALRLLLAGPGDVEVPDEEAEAVVDLGLLSEADKHDACAAATLLVQPSPIESFSIVLMEAWLQGTPVLVNGHCAVTTHHCRQSNGGLYYRDYAEFEACLDYLLERPALRERMGACGRAYVLRHHTWPAVIERLLAAVEAKERFLRSAR
ncbi:MAG: glycosyltransferase family 4 protein [Chloroflexia bacterium]